MFSDTITTANEKIKKGADIVEQFKHVYVPEVVREPKMHYWTVPRLGSFMAIPLVYKSCLSVESFDAAVNGLIQYRERKAAQEDEKQQWETAQQIEKA